MSEQQQKPTEPKLCTLGCGFFALPGGTCCSKCWRETQLRQQEQSEASSPAAGKTDTVDVVTKNAPNTTTDDTVQPMDIDEPVKKSEPVQTAVTTTSTTKPRTTIKKKKKKTSYKNMMNNMMKGSNNTAASNDAKLQKEKDNLRKVTGGGVFSKIDKI